MQDNKLLQKQKMILGGRKAIFLLVIIVLFFGLYWFYVSGIDSKTYSNQEFGFHFKYPKDWSLWECNMADYCPDYFLIQLYPNEHLTTIREILVRKNWNYQKEVEKIGNTDTVKEIKDYQIGNVIGKRIETSGFPEFVAQNGTTAIIFFGLKNDSELESIISSFRISK